MLDAQFEHRPIRDGDHAGLASSTLPPLSSISFCLSASNWGWSGWKLRKYDAGSERMAIEFEHFRRVGQSQARVEILAQAQRLNPAAACIFGVVEHRIADFDLGVGEPVPGLGLGGIEWRHPAAHNRRRAGRNRRPCRFPPSPSWRARSGRYRRPIAGADPAPSNIRSAHPSGPRRPIAGFAGEQALNGNPNRFGRRNQGGRAVWLGCQTGRAEGCRQPAALMRSASWSAPCCPVSRNPPPASTKTCSKWG